MKIFKSLINFKLFFSQFRSYPKEDKVRGGEMKGLCKGVGFKENGKGKGINKVRGGEMKGLCKGGGR